MSEYIKKIEKDYNDGKISIDEISKLRQNYNKLSAYEKGKDAFTTTERVIGNT